jgi:hypothetical protein
MKTAQAPAAFRPWTAVSTLVVAALFGSVSHATDAAAPRTSADLTKPIVVSENGRFLAQPDGQPFFYLGENAEYLLWRLTREETDSYLRDRARKGFTVIMAHMVPRSDMNLPNAYGDPAFVSGDVSRPNRKYFEHIDWVAARAAQYGLRLGLMPINGIEYVTQGKFNASNVEVYGRWLGGRYRDKGIIWILGHDATPIWAQGSWKPSEIVLVDFRLVYDRMAAALTATSGGEAFITYHPPCCNFPGTAEPRTSLYWSHRDWLDMNMLQSSHFSDPTDFLKRTGLAFGWTATRGYEPIRQEYDSLPTRPVVDGEPHWEDTPRNADETEAAGRWDEVDIRNSAYQSVFAGAAGHSYGHVSIYAFVNAKPNPGKGFFKFARAPWNEALDAPGARQIGYVKSLMLSRPYFTRIPDQSIVIGDTGEGSAHIIATRDRSGSYMMVYLPLGQPVTVDLTKLSGLKAEASWFDPRTGTSKRVEDSFSTNQLRRFVPPSSGRGNDWVLVLDDATRKFTAPAPSVETVSP